ncbi:MAG TPA: TAT-variant-translocated molybdopterin oxidoreductase [Polyangiaceae bacterium]|nr:TAT-variant-translocated molybdopterin oxidoreductase [Polyangiaceae bacterium]
MSRRQPHPAPAPSPIDGAKTFWKSLEAKADPGARDARATAEFPKGFDEARALAQAADEPGSVGRRGFMLFAGLSTAVFAEGCARRPVEKILPYTKAPEYALPGVSEHYATVRVQRGEAIGLIAESHEGRPTKIEGNPDHPASRGKTDHFAQASIFDVYDPDRIRAPMHARREGTRNVGHAVAGFAEAEQALQEALKLQMADGGQKLRVLYQPAASPTFTRLRDAVKARFPKAQLVAYTPVNDSTAREGTKLAFGESLNVVHDLSQAETILALDSDFLGLESGAVRNARGFSAGRRPKSPNEGMNRLYVVEPALTITGSNADHRLRLAARDVEGYLLALAKELKALGAGGDALAPIAAESDKVDAKSIPASWLKAVAKELFANKGKSAVLVGARQPARVHAAACAVNVALGNVGRTVNFYPAHDEVESLEELKTLAADMEGNRVNLLVILGGNPAYDAPGDLKFGEKIHAVLNTFAYTSHMSETALASTWAVPRAHELETWGDARALDGTLAVQQPLIQPIHSGRSDLEILALIAGEASRKGHDLVRDTLRAMPLEGGKPCGAPAFEQLWTRALHKGVVAGAEQRPKGNLTPKSAEIAQAIAKATRSTKPLGQDNLELTFAPDARIYDGRFANNPWLLELPELASKITWDNVASLSPATAKALGLESGDMIRITRGAESAAIATWVQPGQGDNTIALTLGWGRQEAGRYGDKHGFNIGPLRTTDAMGFAEGATIAKMTADEREKLADKLRRPGISGNDSPGPGRVEPNHPYDVATGKFKIAQTQDHHDMEGRPVAIDATLEEYRKLPNFVEFPSDARKRRSGSPDPKVLPLWKQADYSKGHKWGMSIDLSACTGCNACVIACQAENNIPVVGKEQIMRGREMAWIRIDRYFVGDDIDNPEVTIQPVACVQCEEAPCENVCPVSATTHSPEGLNDMAYNRCIGTRYCANNCPYKVRRFNFLNYHGDLGEIPEVEKLKFNPNVTVRMRGVMEKCNYCVQRIEEAKIASRAQGRELREGDIVTACAQVCPAQAIVFGDLNDPKSRVAQLDEQQRGYHLLAELGTHPRTKYLGKIRNPNPEMGKA